jgi:hypothetical protein
MNTNNILIIVLLILIIIYISLFTCDHNNNEHFSNPVSYIKSKLSKDIDDCSPDRNKYTISISENLNSLSTYKLINSCNKLLLSSDGEWSSDNIDLQLHNHINNKIISVSFNGEKFEFYKNKDDPNKMIYYTITYNVRLDKLKLIYIFNNSNKMMKITGTKDIHNNDKYNFSFNESIIAYSKYNNKYNTYYLYITDERFVKNKDILLISFIIRNKLI